jgi:hypothetical protein
VAAIILEPICTFAGIWRHEFPEDMLVLKMPREWWLEPDDDDDDWWWRKLEMVRKYLDDMGRVMMKWGSHIANTRRPTQGSGRVLT